MGQRKAKPVRRGCPAWARRPVLVSSLSPSAATCSNLSGRWLPRVAGSNPGSGLQCPFHFWDLRFPCLAFTSALPPWTCRHCPWWSLCLRAGPEPPLSMEARARPCPPPPAPSLALAPCPCHSEPRKPGPFLFGRDSQSLCPCPAGSSQRPQHRHPAQGSSGGMRACSGCTPGRALPRTAERRKGAVS